MVHRLLGREQLRVVHKVDDVVGPVGDVPHIGEVVGEAAAGDLEQLEQREEDDEAERHVRPAHHLLDEGGVEDARLDVVRREESAQARQLDEQREAVAHALVVALELQRNLQRARLRVEEVAALQVVPPLLDRRAHRARVRLGAAAVDAGVAQLPDVPAVG